MPVALITATDGVYHPTSAALIIGRQRGQGRRIYGQLADKPTRRQLNWPKNQLAEIEIVTEIDVRIFGHMDVSFW